MPSNLERIGIFTEFGQKKGKTKRHVAGRPRSRSVPAVEVTNHSKKRKQWQQTPKQAVKVLYQLQDQHRITLKGHTWTQDSWNGSNPGPKPYLS